MTNDEQLIKAALDMAAERAETVVAYQHGPYVEAGHMRSLGNLVKSEIQRIDPAEVLARVGDERCAKCGHPRNNHSYRHPFVGMGNDPLDAQPAADAVARLVEAARWVRDQACEGFCRDLPSATTYDKEMDIDCSGCRIRAALAVMETRDDQ